MSDHVIASREPIETGSSHPEPVSEATIVLTELAAIGVEVDGEIQIAESTWALYGRTSYDGEIVVGEYHDAAEASAVLRAAPRPDSGPHGGPARATGADHEGPNP